MWTIKLRGSAFEVFAFCPCAQIFMDSSFAQTKIPTFLLAWAFALTTFCIGAVLAYHFMHLCIVSI